MLVSVNAFKIIKNLILTLYPGNINVMINISRRCMVGVINDFWRDLL